MRFLVALALLGVALAGYPQVSTRENCPPSGYTALSGAWKLDNLPPYGKYAICLTQSEADPTFDDSNLFNFTWNGVFKLTKSRLLVDRQIRLYAKYPSRVEWNDVTVTSFGDDLGLDDEDWSGIRLEGAPEDLPYPGHLKNKKFGNCGTLNDVSIDQVRDATSRSPLDIVNCSGYFTKFKDISIIHDSYVDEQVAVQVTDSTQLVFEHLTVAVTVTDTTSAAAIVLTNTEAAFIRPVLFSTSSDAMVVADYSNVTVCDGFLRSADSDYKVGVDNADGPVIVAVAGRRNSIFPGDLEFDGSGGILYTLKSCPKKFSSHYDMKLWQEWYTTN